MLAALAVVLGAFGAHALEEALTERDQLANWDTAVRYQMWHALALVLFGLLREHRALPRFIGWGFLAGAVLFSGSIYALCFRFLPGLMGPATPLGGALMIGAWIALGVSCARSRAG